MLDFSMLGQKSLTEMVYDELKDRIMTGAMQAGERVLEVQLAEEMVISRTPVREAIRQLEMDGLLIQQPRKGIYVAEVSSREAKEIMEIRQDIEGMAAYYAASRITTGQRKQMAIECDNYRIAAENNDAVAMMKANNTFHRLLIEASGNHVLIRMAESLQEMITPMTYNNYCIKHALETAAEHSQILQAIVDGDCLRAKLAASRHINMIRPQMN